MTKIRMEEVEITITQRIFVDPCIAAEIKELNDVHNIDTHYSCCGHGCMGWITVKDLDINKMKALGYVKTGRRILWKGYFVSEKTKVLIADSLQYTFKPKSKCTCKKLNKEKQ